MDTNFTYRPLDLAKNQIRLVSIHPGYPSDELVGHIFHVSLEDAPRYEALSYCWAGSQGARETTSVSGILSTQTLQRLSYNVSRSFISRPPPNQGYIRLETQTFNLAVNLEAALRRLRSRTAKVIMWIDAICIDQSNTEERNKQVLKMRQIYKGAALVRVWLGEAYEDSGAAFSFAESLEELWVTGQKHAIVRAMEDPANLGYIDAAVKLFRRAYWQRIWVVQEVASAKDVLVHCGEDFVSWNQIWNLSRVARDYNRPLSLALSPHLWKVGTLLHKGPATFHRNVDNPDGTPKIDLFTLLLIHKGKASTNPKDQIYGLIGITKARGDPRFVLDYSFPLRKVYMSVVRYLLEESGSLSIICASCPGSEIPDLPSWVPDWSRSSPLSGIQDRNIRHCRAASDRKAEAYISPGEDFLSAKGFCIASVRHVGEQHQDHATRHGSSLQTFHKWRNLLMEVKGTEKTDQFAFMRSIYCNTSAGLNDDEDDDSTPTMPANQILGVYGSLSQRPEYRSFEIDAMLEEFISDFRRMYPSRWQSMEGPFVTTTSHSMRGRSFFILEDGQLGTAANQIEIGDKVCALFGCAFFVVLRPRQPRGYTLLGEAYVDGIMEGEALREFDRGKYKKEDFEIW